MSRLIYLVQGHIEAHNEDRTQLHTRIDFLGDEFKNYHAVVVIRKTEHETQIEK